MISHERGKDREVFTTSGTYSWSFVTQIFHSGQPSRGGDRTFFPNRDISIFVLISSFDKEIRIESAQLLFLMCIHRPTERVEGQPGQQILFGGPAYTCTRPVNERVA